MGKDQAISAQNARATVCTHRRCTNGNMTNYMKILKATGFILGRRKLGEADRIVTIFSKEFGKIQVLARGSRKLKAKNIGKLEPFYLIDFQFIRGTKFNILTSVDIIKPYVFFDNKQATVILQIITKYTVDEQSDIKIFWLIEESLSLINDINISVLPYFKLKFWSLEGVVDTHKLSTSYKQLDQLFSKIINNNLDFYTKLIHSTRKSTQINRLEKAVDSLENSVKPN